MFKKAKIFFGLAGATFLLVLASPFWYSIGYADTVDTLQVINSGTLSFLDTPASFDFSSLETSSSTQNTTYTPEEGAVSAGDLIVQDLRFSGGFSVTMQATPFENQYGNSFNCSDFSFVTFNSSDVSGIEESANVTPDVAAVTAPYNGDPASERAYTSMSVSDDPSACEAVEIMSAGAEESEGRIGTWKTYVGYNLNIPAFIPPGTYGTSITFTLVDDTNVPSSFGTGLSVSSSNPDNAGTIYYQNGNLETTLSPSFVVPSYSGGSVVDLEHQLCDSAALTTCYTFYSQDDAYASFSVAGQSSSITFTENQIYQAIAALGVRSGSTVYYKMRLVEAAGEIVDSENYYSFVADQDLADGVTDGWDSTDDVLLGATALGEPTTGTQTHGPHTLSDADFYDWYAFTLAVGETYTFEATDGTGDTYAELFNTEGVSLGVTDDDSGAGLMFSVEHAPVSAGTVYLRVKCKTTGADCGYTLSYIKAGGGGGGDAWDTGDDTGAGATALSAPAAGPQTHGPHTLTATDTYDWFSVSLDSGTEYTFTATSGTGDTYGELYSDSGGVTRVAFDDDSAGSLMFNVVYTPSSSATYYFRSRCYSVGADCGYTLQYSSAIGGGGGGGGSDDAWDPTDNFAVTSTRLSPSSSDTQSHGPHTLSATDTSDWYIVDLVAGREYVFFVLDASAGIRLSLCGENTCSPTLDSVVSTGANLSLTYTAAATGEYYLVMEASPSGADASYTLNYRTTSSPQGVISASNFRFGDQYPLDTGTLYYANGDNSVALNALVYTGISYTGVNNVAITPALCDATLTTCAAVETIVYDEFAGGGYFYMGITKNNLYNAMTSLGFSSGTEMKLKLVAYEYLWAPGNSVEGSNTLTYTLTESATDLDVPNFTNEDNFAITTSSPLEGGVAPYLKDNYSDAFYFFYTSPTYTGDASVIYYVSICTTSDLDVCTFVASAAAGLGSASEHALYTAMKTLNIRSGDNVYVRLIVNENAAGASGPLVSTNTRGFVATLDN